MNIYNNIYCTICIATLLNHYLSLEAFLQTMPVPLPGKVLLLQFRYNEIDMLTYEVWVASLRFFLYEIKYTAIQNFSKSTMIPTSYGVPFP